MNEKRFSPPRFYLTEKLEHALLEGMAGRNKRLVPQDKYWLTGDEFPPLKALVEGLGIVEVVLGELVVLGEVGDADMFTTLVQREGGHIQAVKSTVHRQQNKLVSCPESPLGRVVWLCKQILGLLDACTKLWYHGLCID